MSPVLLITGSLFLFPPPKALSLHHGSSLPSHYSNLAPTLTYRNLVLLQPFSGFIGCHYLLPNPAPQPEDSKSSTKSHIRLLRIPFLQLNPPIIEHVDSIWSFLCFSMAMAKKQKCSSMQAKVICISGHFFLAFVHRKVSPLLDFSLYNESDSRPLARVKCLWFIILHKFI
jgi:hypothetical protein